MMRLQQSFIATIALFSFISITPASGAVIKKAPPKNTAPVVAAENIAAEPVATSVPTSAPATVTTPVSNYRHRGLRVSADGGLQMQSYSLSGTGYSSSINTASGSFWGLKVNYKKDHDAFYSFLFKFRVAQTSFSGLSGLTPSGVTLKNNQYQAVVYAKLLEHLESPILKDVRVGLGYSVIRRSSEVTTPNAAFTSQTQHGLTLNAAYEIPFNEESHIDTYVQFFMPWAFKEDASNTGYHTSTFAFELGADFNYTLTPSIDVSAGLSLRQDRNGFSGTGLRGTTDGSENLTTISVPLNITFKF